MAREEKARAFRWLGPGVLYIRKGEAIKVVPPEGKKSIVTDPMDLEVLGGKRIAEMIRAGQATDELDVASPSTPESEAEHKQAQETAEESARGSAGVEKLAKTAKTAGAPEANARVPPLGTLPPETERGEGLSAGRENQGAGPKADGK